VTAWVLAFGIKGVVNPLKGGLRIGSIKQKNNKQTTVDFFHFSGGFKNRMI
jgi:hypothetical protein